MIESNGGPPLVYVATRLFDFGEKMKAEKLERAVLRAARDVNVDIETFVPFRDTGQTSLTARQIYEADIERLRRSSLLVAFFDGLAKDEGVAFEIGYAHAIGVPILLVSTDFIWSRAKTDAQTCGTDHIFDPVIMSAMSRLVRRYRIPDGGGSFYRRLISALRGVLEDVRAEIGSMLNRERRLECEGRELKTDVFVEVGGGLFEWQREYGRRFERRLRRRQISVVRADRFEVLMNGSATPSACGRTDIERLLRSRVVLTASDGSEMASGSAALHGIAAASGKPIVLYDSKLTDIVSDGTYRTSRNLMIETSALMTARSWRSCADLVEEALMSVREG